MPLSRLSTIGLSRRNRLIVYYLFALGVLVAGLVVAYNAIMLRFEGVDQSIFASLEFVIQTMTTTGYGQDASEWSHPVTLVFVAVTNISTIVIGFFTLRLIVIPLFTGAEVDLDNRLTPKEDHVVVCEYRRDSEVLLDELTELGVDYVLIASDQADARRLSDDGYSAIHGSPQAAETFERASIDTARAVITDAGDANVNTILTVRSVRPDVETIALTDEDEKRAVLSTVGAGTVLSPRDVLGRRLADKVLSTFGVELTDTIDLDGDLEVAEIPIDNDSRLVGRRIRDSKIREETGANVIGAWVDGDLELPPDPNTVIRSNTVLVVSGAHETLEAFSDFTRPFRDGRNDRAVVVGYGEVGRAAAAELRESGIETVTVDTKERDRVDVVGDATDRETLIEADVESADAVIVGLPDDSSALLTIALVRSLDPDVEILARVSDTDATRKALSAGADYVLSVPRVSARMVARELRGEDIPAPANQIRLVRVSAGAFAGTTLAGSRIYERTGCRVIAIGDEAGLSGQIDPQRPLSGDEQLVVAGTDKAVQQFLTTFDASPVE